MTDPCNDALERIYPYLDGEASWVERVKIRWHLRQCGECTDLYEFESRLKTVVKERCEEEEVPDEVVDRLKTFLRDNDCDC